MVSADEKCTPPSVMDWTDDGAAEEPAIEKCTPPSVMDWTDDGAAEEPAMDLEEGTGPDRTAVAAYSGPLASQGVPTPA
jgi:hypothetical protein